MDWINTLAGFCVGTIVGLTGVGGGALMTPILVLLLGVAPATAVGTDLWFAAITKMFGGAVHHNKGSIDWQVLRRLAYGSIPAAILTMVCLYLIGADKVRDGLILNMLGVVMVITAGAMLFKKRFHALGERLRSHAPANFKRAQPGLTVVAGVILGILVSMTSIGAGALGTVMLLYLYPRRMNPMRLVGTDIVHAIPLTIVAGTGHLFLGNVDYALLGALLLGSVPGIILGSFASARAPEAVLRSMIALVLVTVGVKMIG